MADIFEALGSPERRRIVSLLKEKGSMNAGEIAAFFSLTKPTLSHHLKILTEAGVVEREKRGTFVFFHLNLSVMQEALQILFDWVGLKRPAVSEEREAEEQEPWKESTAEDESWKAEKSERSR